MAMRHPSVALMAQCGHTLIAITRVRFIRNERVLSDGGPLVLEFDAGSRLTLSVGSDGATLTVQPTGWSDPFDGHLSSKNQEFISSSGRWNAVDVSDEEPFRVLTGQVVRAVSLIQLNDHDGGEILGATLVVGEHTLTAEVEADELEVTVAEVLDPSA
jgi:hypothetical protein